MCCTVFPLEACAHLCPPHRMHCAACVTTAPHCTSLQGPGTPTSVPPAPEDTPFGFGGGLPPLTGSVAAFKRRCEWFYVDPAGEEHGPVSFQKLMGWYKKGHFPDDVKVGGRVGRGGVNAGVCAHACVQGQDPRLLSACNAGRAEGLHDLACCCCNRQGSGRGHDAPALCPMADAALIS